MNNTFSMTSIRKLRITGCSDPQMWYRNKIGRLVDYCGEWPEAYVSREDDGHLNKVFFQDALIEHVEPQAEPSGQSKTESMTEAALAATVTLAVLLALSLTIDWLERLSTVGMILSPIIFLAAISAGNYMTRRFFERAQQQEAGK